MKNLRTPLTLALAALLCLGTLAQGGGAPGRDVRMGKVSKISGEKATLTLEKAAAGAGTEALAYRPMEVRVGMSVRVVILLGTSVFSMPVGYVDKVADDGDTCLVVVDDSLLDAPVEDPSGASKGTVRDYFKVGAEVSVSR